MLIVASHIICILALFAGSVYDLLTTEVPDYLPGIAVIAGISLHGVESILSGSPEAFLWSLGVGTIFSLYGWSLYFAGMWGGADAFSMSALGFGAPFALTGPSIIHPASLFVNIMVLGLIYTVSFAIYKAYTTSKILETYIMKLKSQRNLIGAEILFSLVFSIFLHLFLGLNGTFYFLAFITVIFLYPWLRILEQEAMSKEVEINEVEPGDVVESREVDGKVKGITKEEIEQIEAKKVTVKSGVRFVPVFPLSLLFVDLGVGGLSFLTFLASLL